MGVIVIVAYKPKSGQEAALDALMAEHVPILRSAGLATARAPIIAKSKDGTVVEVFEWTSEKAIELAHADETVRALWERFEAACDYLPIANVPEAASLFSRFAPLDAVR
jgi:quinol monooxygenase YgiN